MRQNASPLYAILLAFLASATLTQVAFAQVYPAQSSAMTLEQTLEKARERVKLVQEYPGNGSGTPFLSASGVVGASIISGAVFGGIFVSFIWRARKFEALAKAK